MEDYISYILLLVVVFSALSITVCLDNEKETKIILGTSSEARKFMLDICNIEYIAISPNIDEKAVECEDPEELPLEIAKAKSDELMKTLAGQQSILITSDQVVLVDTIREKPRNINEAKEFLKSYSNSSVKTVTAVVVTNTFTGKSANIIDTAIVYFKKITNEQINEICISEYPANIMEKINNYIFIPNYMPMKQSTKQTREKISVFDCAGALAIDHPVLFNKIKKIDGTFSSLMGLPLNKLFDLIDEVK